MDHGSRLAHRCPVVGTNHDTTTGRYYGIVQLTQLVQQSGFTITESFFSLHLKNMRDSYPGPTDKLLICIYKIPLKNTCEFLPDCGLAGAHQANQKYKVAQLIGAVTRDGCRG